MLQTVQHDAERDCQRLAVACYSLMDQGRYEETAALFTDDAIWVRGGKPVAGRGAILNALQQRPATDLSRHIVRACDDVDDDAQPQCDAVDRRASQP